jgi:cytochrome P450
MVAPSMHAKRIMNYADTMTALATEQLKHWQAGTRLDISEEMMALTMKIIASTGFNVAVTDEQIRKIAMAMEGIQGVSGNFSIIPPWIPTPTELRARQGLRDIDEIIYGIIDDRRRTGEDKGDLLSMLLLAEDDQGQHMTAKEARDEAVTMILAGHETTANAMNWTFYLLAQYPEIEAKLHAELDAVLAGRTPTLADLENLRYTEMVIKESMRLMPPVWSFARVATETVKIGAYTIPQGTIVSVITLHAHQDTRYYPDPKRFDPERFTPENEAKLPRGAYIPFGGGPRICIGFSFAMMEARLLLATIASQYKLRLEPGQRVTPQAQITLNPKGGLPMTVLARK